MVAGCRNELMRGARAARRRATQGTREFERPHWVRVKDRTHINERDYTLLPGTGRRTRAGKMNFSISPNQKEMDVFRCKKINDEFLATRFFPCCIIAAKLRSHP